jgi:hypothetical protein
MKTILFLAALLVTVTCSQAQQQPPWLPIENTSSLPPNAIISRFDILTAGWSSATVHRDQITSLSVTGLFALSWFYTNATHVPWGGTLNYYVDNTGFADTATFHLVGPKGRHSQIRDFFTIDYVGSVDLGSEQVRDLVAGKWWLVVVNPDGRHVAARITLPEADGDEHHGEGRIKRFSAEE